MKITTYLKIIDVVILNSGTNYTFDKTRINRVTERGKNAVFNSSVKKLNIVGIQTSRPYNQKYLMLHYCQLTMNLNIQQLVILLRLENLVMVK